MTALAADLTATAGILVLDGALDVGSYPAPYTIDSECVLVTGGDGSTTPSVSRGQNGTAPATHSSGATVTSGWGGGGGVANPMTADLDVGGYSLVGDGGVTVQANDSAESATSLTILPAASADGLVALEIKDQAGNISFRIGANDSPHLTIFNPDGAQMDVDAQAMAFTMIDDKASIEIIPALGSVGAAIQVDTPGAGPALISLMADGNVFLVALPTSDPGVLGQLYSDGAPVADTPKPLMVSGGTS